MLDCEQGTDCFVAAVKKRDAEHGVSQLAICVVKDRGWIFFRAGLSSAWWNEYCRSAARKTAHAECKVSKRF
jgi:hypothetical protein